MDRVSGATSGSCSSPTGSPKDSVVVELRWIRFTTTEKVVSRLLLLVIVALTLGMVYMEVLFNDWQNLFYNTFQDKDKAEFYHQILRFALLASIWIVMAVYSQYLTQMLQMRWRRWLTRRYLREWLADRTYYRMQLVGAQTDNPDQRVAEDLKIFVDETLNLSLGLLNAVVTLALLRRHPLGAVGPAHRSRCGSGVRHSGVYGLGGADIRHHRQPASLTRSATRSSASTTISSVSKPTSATTWCGFARTWKASRCTAARRTS